MSCRVDAVMVVASRLEQLKESRRSAMGGENGSRLISVVDRIGG